MKCARSIRTDSYLSPCGAPRAATDVHYSTAFPRHPSRKGILLRDKASIE